MNTPMIQQPQHRPMDRHIQQTNDRLSCIKQHLISPQGFQSAARELLDWCTDTRAFQSPFEQGLMTCLTVVSQVAASPGYDLDLGYRLLAVCASNKEKLSPKSASVLTLWSEELGRKLLLRHQNTPRQTDPMAKNLNPPMQPMQQPMAKCFPPLNNEGSSMAGMNWPAANNQPTQQPSVSIVTTVWGTTQTTQTIPFANQNAPMPGNGPTYSSKPGYGGPMMPGGNPRNPTYTRPGYPPTPNTPGSQPGQCTDPQNPSYQTSSTALSTAALMAAAATATATATATASVVALQEQQQQQQQQTQAQSQVNYGPMVDWEQQGYYEYDDPSMANQYGPMGGNNYGGQRMPGPGMNKPGPMYQQQQQQPQQRRVAPYPNPQQYIQQRRQTAQVQQGNPYMAPPHYGSQSNFGPGQPQQFNSVASQQVPGGYAPTMGQQQQQQQQQQMRPRPPYGANQNAFGAQHNQPMNPPYSQQQQMANYNYEGVQYNSMPGNPTPPMTPANGGQAYGQPNAMNTMETKPLVKPPLQSVADEFRLTFPVRDGIILPPFRLEHNLAVSNHVFHLRPSIYQTLMWRSDLELQLKCFHHEDRQMNTNWPASVSVTVNAHPLTIERSVHRPLYLKGVCQTGRNTIQITVSACCCSHLFVLQLVHRPSVKSVLQGLLRKRLLPAEHCITKIKRNFQSSSVSSGLPGEDGVEQTAIKASLKCPITRKRISLPARGHDCKHIPCFDLESYLHLNVEKGTWRCPICNKNALLEGLEIDQYIWGILTTLQNADYEEVTLDQTANWRPVPLKPVKEEETQDSCMAKHMKMISPSSMIMPTMQTWQMNNPSSPYTANYDNPQVNGQPNGVLPPYPGTSGQMQQHNQSSNYMNSPYPNPSTPGVGNPGTPNIDLSDPLASLADIQDTKFDEKSATPNSQSNPPSIPQRQNSRGTPNPTTPGSSQLPPTPNSQSQPPTPVTPASAKPSNQTSPAAGGQQATTPNGNGTLASRVQQAQHQHQLAPPPQELIVPAGVESNDLSTVNLTSDLNFDPVSAMIDSNGNGNDTLDLLPDDPLELLSYLGPDNNASNNPMQPNNNDDLFSLLNFDT